MKVTFGVLVVTAGTCGALSFAFLATALGTDYWYVIESNPVNSTDSEDLSSHSGLWGINEVGKNQDQVDTFSSNYSRFSETEMQMLTMHSAIVVLLPLSLVLLLLGGICGLISSLARSPVLLTAAASYFFLCSLLTLTGATLYILYSYRALAETETLVGREGLSYVRTSFGWSLALAWLSYALELLTGALLLTAAQKVKPQRSGPILT